MLIEVIRNNLINHNYKGYKIVHIDLHDSKRKLSYELYMSLPTDEAIVLNEILDKFREARLPVSTLKLAMIQQNVYEGITVRECLDIGGGLG